MSYTMAATLFVVATEALVWFTLYAVHCRRQRRLMFGKLRVRLFKYSLRKYPANSTGRYFWAAVLFGRYPMAAASYTAMHDKRCVDCLDRLSECRCD